MASWDSKEVTNEHLLPYVDSKTAPPDVAAALNVLPFERNVFKVSTVPDYQFQWPDVVVVVVVIVVPFINNTP